MVESEDDDGLFADVIPAASVTIIRGGRGVGAQIEEAWRAWADATSRPDRDRVPERFRAAYRAALALNFAHAELLECVVAAAHLEPRPRDPEDTRRVLMVLQNYDHERAAKAARREGAPIISYPRPDVETALATLADVARLTTERRFWTEDDLSAAGLLIGAHDAAELSRIAEAALLVVEQATLRPIDLLRHRGAAATGSAGRTRLRGDRDSYGAGRAEAARTADIDFAADPEAERMLLRGVPQSEISQFHHAAPPGYWDAVLEELVADPSSTHEAIYARLRDAHGWHPEERQTPPPERK